MTIQPNPNDVTHLTSASNYGYQSSDLFESFEIPDGFSSAPMVDASHFDLTGAAFEFAFDDQPLDIGQSVNFKMYYGAASNQTEAEAALAAVGAEVYALAKPAGGNGQCTDEPNVFIMAFTGVGGSPLFDPPTNVIQPDVSENPSSGPTAGPSAVPSPGSSAEPSSEPSVDPSSEPSSKPSLTPTIQPSSTPSTFPSSIPSANPTTMFVSNVVECFLDMLGNSQKILPINWHMDIRLFVSCIQRKITKFISPTSVSPIRNWKDLVLVIKFMRIRMIRFLQHVDAVMKRSLPNILPERRRKLN